MILIDKVKNSVLQSKATTNISNDYHEGAS